MKDRTFNAIPDQPWMDDGLCRGLDPDLFYPAQGEDSRPAKMVCAECPVRLECLDYAITHREIHGVWGGMSERQRRSMRGKRLGADGNGGYGEVTAAVLRHLRTVGDARILELSMALGHPRGTIENAVKVLARNGDIVSTRDGGTRAPRLYRAVDVMGEVAS